VPHQPDADEYPQAAANRGGIDQRTVAADRLHADRKVHPTRAVGPPIYQTATFWAEDAEQFAQAAVNRRGADFYTRYGNPNHAQASAVVAELEHAEAAMVTASGMAALTTAVLALVSAGDHVIGQKSTYGGTASVQSGRRAHPVRTLLSGGIVVSMDPAVGDLDRGDVLIQDGVIAGVAERIDAPDAEVIDATDRIVLPGLVDTHRHTWQTAFRVAEPRARRRRRRGGAGRSSATAPGGAPRTRSTPRSVASVPDSPGTAWSPWRWDCADRN
jgi:hypothetical protein